MNSLRLKAKNIPGAILSNFARYIFYIENTIKI